MNFDFSQILIEVVRQKASDLHITSGSPPMLRKRGQLVPMEGLQNLTPTDTREIVYTILNSPSASAWRRTGSSTSPTPFPARAGSASTRTSSAAHWAPPSV